MQPQPTSPPPLPLKHSQARKVGLFTSILLTLFYAGLARLLFDTNFFLHSGGVVSLSFVVAVPVALGFLSVAIGRAFGSDNEIFCSLSISCIALFAGFIICIITKLEALICVIMAAPIMFAASVTGGVLAHLILPPNNRKNVLYVSMAVFFPYLLSFAEGSLHWPCELKSIENTITIHAPAERIWPEIASVSAIDPSLIKNRWIYWVGFPKPIAATLDHEGVGGIRTATFERDVSFFETVTVWDKPKRLAFSIHADPHFIPHTAFDQHIIVGGRFYDVLDGLYEIEPLPDGSCTLHLTSTHRLGTRFNAYAGWWSERVMDQIQGSILEVIRDRAEKNPY